MSKHEVKSFLPLSVSFSLFKAIRMLKVKFEIQVEFVFMFFIRGLKISLGWVFFFFWWYLG
jgi:hypothetical protein